MFKVSSWLLQVASLDIVIVIRVCLPVSTKYYNNNNISYTLARPFLYLLFFIWFVSGLLRVWIHMLLTCSEWGQSQNKKFKSPKCYEKYHFKINKVSILNVKIIILEIFSKIFFFFFCAHRIKVPVYYGLAPLLIQKIINYDLKIYTN